MNRANITFEKVPGSQTEVNPRATAGFFSCLSFNWLNNLLQLGNARPLEADDLYPLLPEHESEQLTDTLERAWKLECKVNHPRPSLLKALLNLTTFKEFFFVMTLTFTRTISYLLIPILLSLLLAILEENTPKDNYLLYVYGLAIILCAFTTSFLLHLIEYRASMIGMRVRVALTGLLYKKILQVQATSCYIGEQYNVLNLVSNDINRFNLATTYLPSILLALPEVVFVLGVIVWFIGWSSLLGSLAVPLIALIQLWCARNIARLREKSTSYADKRVSLTAEVIRGIRVVKMSTWEQYYQQFIREARRFLTKYIEDITLWREHMKFISKW